MSAAAAQRPLLLAGAGSIGRRHLDNLRHLGGGTVELWRTGRGTLPAPADVAVWTDLEQALERRPRAVLVCNPTALHVEVALAAARAGSHLFVEKPLSHHTDGLAELESVVAERRLTVLVGYHLRFHPTLRRCREWLRGGAVGQVVSAHAHWGEHLPDWHPWEDCRASYSARRDLGGGAVLTLSHPLDTLRWLLGEVTSVMARTARRSGLGLDVEDTAAMVLTFASGALGCVYVDYVERPRRHTLVVVGTEGSIDWDDTHGIASLRDADGRVSDVAPPPLGFSRNDLYLAEMRHFLACLDGKESPACGLGDGRAVVRVAGAALRSAEEGRAVDVGE